MNLQLKTSERKMQLRVRKKDSVTKRQKEIESQRKWKKIKDEVGLNRLSERDSKSAKRWEDRIADRALRQRGEKNAARSRHRANGPTTVNIMALCGTHTLTTHTAGRRPSQLPYP